MVRRLRPDWRDAERFYELRSEITGRLTRLARVQPGYAPLARSPRPTALPVRPLPTALGPYAAARPLRPAPISLRPLVPGTSRSLLKLA